MKEQNTTKMSDNRPDQDLITITFVTLKQSCFIESNKNFMFAFLKLFEHSTNKEGVDYLIHPIQTNTLKLKQKISRFIKAYGDRFPSFNRFITFLNLLPEDQYFLIVDGKLTDTQKILQYFTYLTRYHNERGKPQKIDERFFDWGATLEMYNLQSFGHQRKSIGGKVPKEERVCRFCRTQNGEVNSFGTRVSFRNKSHAFSEALGNKNVISLDECDACNERFSTGCEFSLINLLSLFRSLHGLKGKGGQKTLRGKNFTLDPQKGFDIKYDGTIDPTGNIDRLEMNLELNDSVTPQDVYRCLAKFVISVVDDIELEFLDQTIEWVNGGFNAEKLPQVAILQASNFYKESPMLNYYSRKINGLMPYLIGEFHYADMVYVFIIPFCEKDGTDFIDKAIYDDYWTKFNIRSSFDWAMKDFSSYEPINLHVNVNIEGIVFGENTFIKKVDK